MIYLLYSAPQSDAILALSLFTKREWLYLWIGSFQELNIFMSVHGNV